MSRVIKKRICMTIALLLTVLVVLAVVPSMPGGTLRAKAASYFSVYFLPGKDSNSGWNNQYIRDNGLTVYLYTFDGKFRAMTEVTQDVYCVDTTSKPNGMIFVLNDKPVWPTDSYEEHWRRTVDVTNVGNSGTCYYINGFDSSTNKKTVAIDDGFNIPGPLTGGTRRIYFDATFSKLSYEKDVGNNAVKSVSGNAIPAPGGNVYYYMTDGGNQKWSGQMTRDGSSDYWYVDIVPGQQTKIRFTGWPDPRNGDKAASGNGTGMLDIPTNLQNPTFVADTGDASVYDGGNRGGYWAEKGTLRDAEKAKDKDVVPIIKESFTEAKDTLYLNSTMYDYYTDYELNGNNRSTYSTGSPFSSHRNWVPFRQFAQALSDYYKEKGVPYNNTIYTGHFQPSVNGWDYHFSEIGNTLNLYGWSESNADFQVNNNSVKSKGSNEVTFYRYATQGIASSALSGSNITMDTSNGSKVNMPFFDEAFLSGTNSKNAKLGEVYSNVAFPFTKVDRDGNGIYYWSYDSAATVLKLRENSNTANNGTFNYFLKTVQMATITDAQKRKTEASRAGGQSMKDGELTDNALIDRSVTEAMSGNDWSRNRVSSGGTELHVTGIDDDPSNKYGYLPLNDEQLTIGSNAANYNYGFGTKIEFEFGLANDGNISITKPDGTKLTAATTFSFSGDDDMWVYIDGKLVLDIGGDHGRTSGCINFSKDKKYEYLYTYKLNGSDQVQLVRADVQQGGVYVSDVKNSANHSGVASPATNTLWNALGITDDAGINQFYKEKHTLTFYFMERGMWESNMRIQFNFPEHDTFEVEKNVDTSDVNNDMKDFFNDISFDFNIKNLVTHYGTQETEVTPGYSISQADIRDYGSAKGPDGQAGTTPTLMNAANAKYKKKTANDADYPTTLYPLGNDARFNLKDGQRVLFDKQFRRGSYISVTEVLSDDATLKAKLEKLYTTTWAVSEGSTIGAQGTGLTIGDSRVEKKDSYSGGNINDYTQEANPGNAILLRSYEYDSAAADVKLLATFNNKVNTGNLEIKKAKAQGSEDLDGTYSYKVTFKNIGGVGLTNNGSTTVEKTYPTDGTGISVNGKITITGIPVGTEYEIVEIPSDGSTLDSVTGTQNDATVTLGAFKVTGVISYKSNAGTKGETDTLTFNNKKTKETVDITVEKRWYNVSGVKLPQSVTFQLQRMPNSEGSTWTPVTVYERVVLNPNADDVTETTIQGTSNKSWTKQISGLDKTDANGVTYLYRIVEYSADGTRLLGNGDYFSPNYKVNITGNPDITSAGYNSRIVTINNEYEKIVMPETGVTPLFNFAMIGFSAIGIAFVALLIYKRKLQKADVKTDNRGGHED